MSIADAQEQRAQYRDELRKLHREAMAEIDRLIALLDRFDGDPDFEPENDAEPDNDSEPSLGSINPTISGGQHQWSFGSDDDREDEHDGREEDDSGIADAESLLEQVGGAHLWGRETVGGAKAVE